MTQPLLRAALPADLDDILAIERAVFSDPWSPASFTPEFTDPYTWFRVAAVDGHVRGYVIAHIVARQGEIANIAVSPAHQGSGLGGALLDGAVAAAEAESCEAVWLEVRVSNEAARRLYASRGFEPIGRRRGYYRLPVEDALVLRRGPLTAEQRAESGARIRSSPQ
ncbi:MAG TPA: ribosomal protein S18-alanine N-acetyltransferase [Gemmatimonadaceae bacterium]|nr:ribosomal protein S18-alanine N-acetyltransferase [Gemmatimonadaceae bacterium]